MIRLFERPKRSLFYLYIVIDENHFLFNVKCPKCKEWFRTESDMNETQRHIYCRHCH